jgi:hypothetical protein
MTGRMIPRENIFAAAVKVPHLLFLLLFLLPVPAFGQTSALSLGYGFGVLNPHQEFGKVQDDRSYNFLYLSYLREKSLFEKAFGVVEPFITYVHKPEAGLEVGFNLLFRYYLKVGDESLLFGNLGMGAAYTSVDFKEQGTHFLFSPQVGIGFRRGRLFIENRLRHYSNAHLAEPNKAVNADLLLVGIFF